MYQTEQAEPSRDCAANSAAWAGRHCGRATATEVKSGTACRRSGLLTEGRRSSLGAWPPSGGLTRRKGCLEWRRVRPAAESRSHWNDGDRMNEPWYVLQESRIRLRMSEVEHYLQWILLQWLGQHAKAVSDFRWVDQIRVGRSAATTLDSVTRERVARWLDDVDAVRRQRNLFAHATITRFMVGPGEGEEDEDPDRFGLIKLQGGEHIVTTMTRTEMNRIEAWCGEVSNAGLALLSTGLRSSTMPPLG